MNGSHVSVLKDEVVELLTDIREGCIVDGTVGQAGHAFEMLQATPPSVRLLAFDRDPQAIRASRERLEPFKDRVRFFQQGYEDLASVLADEGPERVEGILLDLGLSTTQLDSDRGFSFGGESALDMRFDPTGGQTASQVIRTTSERSLASSLKEIGQVPASKRLARVLKERARAGKMDTTADLVQACRSVLGARVRKMDSATLPAMVLRILTNRELDRLDGFLADLPSMVSKGGKVVILSYHSGEDGRVKRAFRALVVERGWTLPYKKGLKPLPDEVAINRRARSARLRVAVRGEEAS